MADVPHFDFPLRLFGSNMATTEQDSIDDIANCVEVICLTPHGWFPELPDFGLTDPTFNLQPLDPHDIVEEISEQEPRAEVLVETAPDKLDNLIARVQVEVQRRGV
jgi:hypothetical protein